MRISIDAPDRLVITHRPVTLAVVLGLIFLLFLWVALALWQEGNWFGTTVMLSGALVVGLLGAALIRRTDLILDRRAGEADLRHATLFRKTHMRWPLSEVTGAQVQQAFSRNGTHTHRPALSLSGGRVQPLTPNFSHGPAPREVATAISRWLKDAARP
ncbi:MAG TPA: hypothetical protein VI412_10350 [Tabrizicola sp.]